MERLGSQIANKLCTWFAKNKRKLAWRGQPSAYEVLVSEIMLQQTRVTTVEVYYKNWMQKFPSIEKLAAAELPEVLKLWEGLGYYKRCENLWQSARKIVKNFDAKVPENKKDLLQLAGIGNYTASAICSLAYKQKIPAIDCNAKRVLSRLFAYQKTIQNKAADCFFEKKASELMIKAKAEIFNQALMELGALVCTAKKPKCTNCPLQKNCQAFQKKLTCSIPYLVKSKKSTALTMNYWIIQNQKKQLLICNPKNTKWWRGLWVFPYFFADNHSDFKNNHFLTIQKCLSSYKTQKIGSLKHQVTTYKISANYWFFTEKNKSFSLPLSENYLWLKQEKLQNLALPVASRYGFQLLMAMKNQPPKP